MRVVLGQIDSKIANKKYNLEKHLEVIKKGRILKADTIVFPELSMSGYTVRDAVIDTFIKPEDEILNIIKDKAGDSNVVFGGVERGEDDYLYNSGFVITKESLYIHRKMYLPTYGMFDEGRFFKRGNNLTIFNIEGLKCGLAICEDMWHISVPYLYSLKGIKVLFVIAGSPGKGISKENIPLNALRWERMLYVYSMLLGIYIVFVNRSGVEDGVSFWGGSAVYAPGGDTICKAKYFEEDLIYCDIDEDSILNYRVKAPIMKDENIFMVLRELSEIENGY